MSEFKVGDYVVHPKFSNRGLYKIYEISGSITKVQLMPNGRKSYSFESDIRHATPEEIAVGHRIDEVVPVYANVKFPYNVLTGEQVGAVIMGFDPGRDITHDLGDDFPIENRISPHCKAKDV